MCEPSKATRRPSESVSQKLRRDSFRNRLLAVDGCKKSKFRLKRKVKGKENGTKMERKSEKKRLLAVDGCKKSKFRLRGKGKGKENGTKMEKK